MATKTTILIADDQPTNLRMLYEALEQAAYTVRAVNSGEAAIASAGRAPPDLILLDVMMPGIDGFETCRRLKADPITREVPVIFMTALTEAVDEVQGLQLGAVDYITKPIRVETVLARVATHLTLRCLQQTLQKRNADLDAYARTVAHDLKNPLSAMLGSAKILLTQIDELDKDELMQYLGLICTAGERAMMTIDELLVLASTRQEQVDLAPLDMAAIVNHARVRIAALNEQYGGTIVLPDAWPAARGYAPWVELVWANYMSNGLKYGGRPPRLELDAARQRNGTVRFWVVDNGPGVPPDAFGRLFTEWTRLEPDRALGHGLGLATVRRIVEKLGGEVGVESTVGQGSKFYFTLPAE